MAYRLAWQVEKQVVLLSMQQDSSIEDFGALARELSSRYLDSGCAPIHLLVDMTRLEKFPHQLAKLRAQMGDLFEHPALGKVVLVGRANPLAGCIVDTLARTFDVECVRAASREDALHLVAKEQIRH